MCKVINRIPWHGRLFFFLFVQQSWKVLLLFIFSRYFPCLISLGKRQNSKLNQPWNNFVSQTEKQNIKFPCPAELHAIGKACCSRSERALFSLENPKPAACQSNASQMFSQFSLLLHVSRRKIIKNLKTRWNFSKVTLTSRYQIQ